MIKPVLNFLHGLGQNFSRACCDTIVTHDGMEHAGYLAFLGLLALFPFLVFATALIGVVDPGTPVASYLASLIRQLPHQFIQALEPRIQEITTGPPQGLLTIAIIGAIWTASSAVEGMRTILNRAYRVHNPPRYLLRRTLSILQLIVFTFFLIVGMILLVTIPALLNILVAWVPIPLITTETLFWSRAIYFGSLGSLVLLVAWIYYAVPNIRQHWVSVWPGALLVVLMWVGAAKLFGLYLTNFNQVTLIYGSLGGIIAAIVFFYICNIILILGAEFNYHISQWAGMAVEEREVGGEEPGP